MNIRVENLLQKALLVIYRLLVGLVMVAVFCLVTYGIGQFFVWATTDPDVKWVVLGAMVLAVAYGIGELIVNPKEDPKEDEL